LQTQCIGRQEAKRGLLAADGTCKDLVWSAASAAVSAAWVRGREAKGKGKDGFARM